MSKSHPIVSATVPIYIVKEHRTFVAYCPVLELSSYGDSIREAKHSFAEAFEIFVEDTIKKGTLEKELLNLGWQADISNGKEKI